MIARSAFQATGVSRNLCAGRFEALRHNSLVLGPCTDLTLTRWDVKVIGHHARDGPRGTYQTSDSSPMLVLSATQLA